MATVLTYKERLEQVYLLYESSMYRAAYHVLNNGHDAEDAVQNALLRIAPNLHRFDEELTSARNRQLVLVITKNAAIDLYRQRQARYKKSTRIAHDKLLDCPSEDAFFDDILIQRDATETLIRHLHSRDPLAAKVLLLKHYYGYKHREIAELLGISIKQSQNRCAKAVRILRSSELAKTARTLLLVLLLLLLAACAVARYGKQIYDAFSAYFSQHSQTQPAQTVGYVAEGFALIEQLRADDLTLFVYECGDAQYTVTIITAQNTNQFIDTENADTEYLSINGRPCEIITFDNKPDAIGILFTDSGCVEVIGSISREEIIKILESTGEET